MAETWQRMEYSTWDEAFRGLAPVIRQQSARVADYTRELYMQACEDGFGRKNREWEGRVRGQYADTAYKCGLYHQIGKALVPPEYQKWRDDFTAEELAVYRKYTSDGRLLAAALQEKGARKKKVDTQKERPTKNIPWLMIREACGQHMERCDGSGYPEGLTGDQISPIGQIVGLARELDRLASETRSENPFDEACETLIAQSGVLWSSVLIEILKNSREKCREVYEKYIYYTLTIPKTIPLAERREGRPMGLCYRPMIDPEKKVRAFEAAPWFQTEPDGTREYLHLDETEHLLLRTGLLYDTCLYLLYEAADAALRAKNCGLSIESFLMRLPIDFYTHESMLPRLVKLCENEGIPRDMFYVTIPEAALFEEDSHAPDIVRTYIKEGFALVLDGFHPKQMSAEQLKDYGFTWLRLAPELIGSQETANAITVLRRQGFHFIGGGADTAESLEWQLGSGVSYVSGTLTGPLMEEDEMIRTSLIREQSL